MANPHIAPVFSASYLMIEQQPASITLHRQRMKDQTYYMRECGMKDINMFSATNIRPRKSTTAT
jgi:hypothetical protein